MDSLTQIVLGAAVGEAVLGKKLGNKAMLLGAVAGTIPDLDVVLKLFNSDPTFELRTHRAYSHSVFTHILLAFPLAWLSKGWSKADISKMRWYWFWFLGLFTHALLDCFTTYGTRLFLPFTDYQVAFNNISVIDPLYTLPWLIVLIVALFFKRGSKKRDKWVKAGWIWSSAYMLLTFGLKYGVHSKFEKTLTEQKVPYTELNTTPTILNASLWAAIAYDDNTLSVAEYSYLNTKVPIKWTSYKRNRDLAKEFPSDSLNVALWFSDGQYFFQGNKDSARLFTTKFGRFNSHETDASKAFMFYADLYRDEKGNVIYDPLTPDDVDFEFWDALKMLSDRIGITN